MTIFAVLLTENKNLPTKSDTKVIKPKILLLKNSIKIQTEFFHENH